MQGHVEGYHGGKEAASSVESARRGELASLKAWLEYMPNLPVEAALSIARVLDSIT